MLCIQINDRGTAHLPSSHPTILARWNEKADHTQLCQSLDRREQTNKQTKNPPEHMKCQSKLKHIKARQVMLFSKIRDQLISH